MEVKIASPFLTIERASWAPLVDEGDPGLSAAEVAALQDRNQSLSIAEVEQVYLPLAKLIGLRIEAARALSKRSAEFLDMPPTPVPFVIGLAGSVAVGKSTTARVLRALLSRGGLDVALVPTDGFLLPNAELEKRGLLHRKGFPKSYDQRALLDFVHALKSGAEEVRCPVYSHTSYDVVADDEIVLRKPDVAIVEGLNVLQTGTGRSRVFVSDYFDFSIYVDAAEADLRRWYVARFQKLRETAFQNPDAYFHRYASLTAREAEKTALGFWTGINLLNLQQNILDTRERADLILAKGSDHRVSRVKLRKA